MGAGFLLIRYRRETARAMNEGRKTPSEIALTQTVLIIKAGAVHCRSSEIRDSRS